jgi:prenyltransferase beta subunit
MGVGCHPAWGQPQEEKQATIAFLQALQRPDGGFLPAPGTQQEARSSLRATSAALQALNYFGGQPRDKMQAAQFVRKCFDARSGGFADQPGGKPDVILTAVGLIAVGKLDLQAPDVVDAAVKYLANHAKSFEEIRMAAAGLEAVPKRSSKNEQWLGELAKLRNADGTFGKGQGQVRATGSAAAAILRLGGMLEHRDRVLQVLQNGQRPDGGYGKEDAAGSDLETSYRVVRSLTMLKAKPAEVGKLQAFIARCRNADGGYGVAPGQRSTVAGTYFAGTLLHWLAE